MFLKVGETPKNTSRLYMMEITMPLGIHLIKFGKSSGKSSKARVLQICSDIFDKYRTTPMIHLKRDRHIEDDKVFEYETTLHNFFKNYRYTFGKKWDGHTECYVIPLEDALQAYEAVIEGNKPDFTYELIEHEEDKVPF
jgi:hypothetical protein